MTKHKHAEIIKAKVDNMDLVLFTKSDLSENWLLASFGDLAKDWRGELKFFLCLPKHKEACLHWLNGGEVQIDRGCGEFVNGVCPPSDYHYNWFPEFWYMLDDYQSRIKPRKEKRWMGFNSHDDITTSTLYESLEHIKNATVCHNEWQFIEIEIEVTK